MKNLKLKTFKLATLGILSLGTIVGATFPAQAAPNGAPHNGQHNGQHRGGSWTSLNLSAEQKAQLKTIMQSQRASVQAVKSDTSLSPQEKKAQLKAINADTQARVNAILTPEQQAKWKAMRRSQLNHKREDLKELNLSDAQKAQIKAIYQNAKAQIASAKNDTSLDQAQQREQIRAIRRDSMQRVNAILTPEQQAKLAQMRREHRGHRKNGGARHNGAQSNDAQYDNGGLNG